LYFEDVSARTLPENGRVTPRWVWSTWTALLSALAIGLILWVVHLAVDGVPGPVLAGVYIAGAVDVAVLAVYIVAAGALTTIAAVMIGRVPENRIGWILGAMSVWMVSTFLVIMVLYFFHTHGQPGWDLANWLGTWTFVPTVPSSLVLILFPTGRLLSKRWRVVPWLAVLGTAGWALSEATGTGIGLREELTNPYSSPDLVRIADTVAVLLLPALVGTVASLVIRFRRSSPEARLQIKWVAFGGVLQVAVILLAWGTDVIRRSDFPVSVVLVGMLSMLIVPIALSVAILRYRLYAIDRLVSRTASYTLLAALVAGGSFGGVIGTQALLGFSNELAVAGTTLALFTLFNPVRRRLHSMMDRRFNRSRFDADRVAEAFAARVGAAAATDGLLVDLETTVRQTLAPASFGMWTRD
jgi:hypothetical protein